MNLYESLSDLLEQPEYQRIALYLPFEFLPRSTWEPDSSELKGQMERFKGAYMEAWENLLFTHDVRSNFTDGEATDEEIKDGTVARVAKAAHLVPKLVEAGLMTVEAVIGRIENTQDEVLRNSLADTLPVLADLGLIGLAERARMKRSGDWFVRGMEREMDHPPKSKQVASEILPLTTFEIFQKELSAQLASAEAARYEDMRESRVKWLKSEGKRKAIEAGGEGLFRAILEGGIAPGEIEAFVSTEATVASQQALVEGVRRAIESLLPKTPEKARTIYESYQDTLRILWELSVPEVRDALRITFCRLNSAGVMPSETLAELGIVRPELAGPFSQNLKRMEAETESVKRAIEFIQNDPELSKYFYPVALVFGSRLKGYASSSSDMDLGVFVRPGVSHEDRTALKAILKSNFAYEGAPMEVKQFWLDETGENLVVHDFQDEDLSVGESHWTHVLFGGAWVGDEVTVNELKKKLLSSYFYETDKSFYGHQAHGFYLEAMERDILLFRLAHRGYANFHMPCGGMNTPRSYEIDGGSAFWDSGYRQVATQLFARRVFLPKIARTTKD